MTIYWQNTVLGIIVSICAYWTYFNTKFKCRVSICRIRALFFTFSSDIVSECISRASLCTVTRTFINVWSFWTFSKATSCHIVPIKFLRTILNTFSSSSWVIRKIIYWTKNNTSTCWWVCVIILWTVNDTKVGCIISKIPNWSGWTTSRYFANPIKRTGIIILGALISAIGTRTRHRISIRWACFYTSLIIKIWKCSCWTIYLMYIFYFEHNPGY